MFPARTGRAGLLQAPFLYQWPPSSAGLRASYPGGVHVTVRPYAELVELSGSALVEVPVGGPRGVKDVIESIGIPHPEVALVLVDGEPVPFDHLVHGGERVSVYPPFHSLELDARTTVSAPTPRPARFVLDVHLGTLTRRMRVLGFDCWYRSDAGDQQLTDVAVDEQRILLTRDRGLLMRKVIRHGYCPRSDDPDLQVLEVVYRFDLAGRVQPFTRCVSCNQPLEPVEKAEVLERLPPRTRVEHDRFKRCTGCSQVFWPGSHRADLDEVVNAVRALEDR